MKGKFTKLLKMLKKLLLAQSITTKEKDEIKIITERCIFNVENGKVILKDVFPGIDIQNDILNQMEFNLK